MTGKIEISGLDVKRGEQPVAFCVLRMEKDISHKELDRLVRKLGFLTGMDAETELVLPEEELRLVVLPWAPPDPDSLEPQRAALEKAGEEERIERAWFFQVGTTIAGSDTGADSEDDEEEDEEEEEEEDEPTWSNGPPPEQQEVPFPLDGYPEIVEEFDWYDFGIAVKLGGQSLSGEDAVLTGFHQLWLLPCLGCFRNTDVTIDHVHRAVHFWVDRYTVPLSPEQSVHNLLWVMARLNEVIPVVHATFQPATMGQKYGPLFGETGEPLVLAGNPLASVYRSGGLGAVESWRRGQSTWSDLEIAHMLRQIAMEVILQRPCEEQDEDTGCDEEEEEEREEEEEEKQDPARLDAAARLLEKALALAPQDDQIQYTYGRVLLDAGRAGELIEAMISFDTDTKLQLANEMGKLGSDCFIAALDMLLADPLPESVLKESSVCCGGGGASISSFGNHASELLSELVGHAISRSPDRLEKLTALLPSDVETLGQAAHRLGEAGHRKHALAAYRRLMALPPPERGTSERTMFCQAFNNACIYAQLEQETELAVKIADQAQDYGRENPFIFHSSACAYASAGDMDRAFEQVELAVDHDYIYLSPDCGHESSCYLETDDDLGELCHQPRFKELFDRWRAFRPKLKEGTEALENKDAKTAIRLLTEASAAESPLARMALINLGLALRDAGKLEELWSSSLDALKRFPSEENLFANLIHAGQKLERVPEIVPLALELYRVLLPEPRTIQNVTYVLNESGEYERSTEAIEWWVEKNGDLPAIAMGNSVNAYLKTGRTHEGLRWARRYVEADDSATAHWFLSFALLRSGDLHGALEAAQACLERDVDLFRQLSADPDMARLTEDPRFGELTKLAGLLK